MVSNTDPGVNFFLSDLSQNDKPWDKHKADSVHISNAFSRHQNFAKRGYNINQCADWLTYHATNDTDKPLKLSQANFCRDRACPVCQWRRALRWVATMHQQLPAVNEKYPTHRWLFVTLTVQNCDIHDLRDTIQSMNKGFKSLIRTLKKKFPTIGYVRTTEVTRGKNDTAHPHFHVMMLVPASYFTIGYIKQADWVTMWQDAMKLDYMPIVDVRAVKPKKNTTQDAQNSAVSHAIAETMKYSVKPSDLLKTAHNGDYDWMYEYFAQTKGLRFLVVGGSLKGLIKAEWQTQKETDDDFIHVGDDEKEPKNDQEPTEIIFNFNRFLWRYCL